jgi:hypothetical protein
MSVTDWLLDGDPSIRWQVMRDLDDRATAAADVAAERARVEHEGWGVLLTPTAGRGHRGRSALRVVDWWGRAP